MARWHELKSPRRMNGARAVSRPDGMASSEWPHSPVMRAVSAAAAVVVWGWSFAAHAQLASDALPQGGRVAAGQVTIQSAGSRMDVLQSTPKAIVNWDRFNVGSGAQVHFQQPSSSAAILNRVTTSEPSQIHGQITANGQVYLVNPNGVLFGQNAKIDAAGLVASTLNLSDQQFLGGQYRFSGGGQGALTNQGLLRGGFVALVGPEVRNEGSVVASVDQAAMASGDAVTLRFADTSLVGIEVEAARLKSALVNTGSITAAQGQVVLKASAAQALVDDLVNTPQGAVELQIINGVPQLVAVGGTVQAKSVKVDAGDTGAAVINGRVDVSSSSGQAGQVEVTGKVVALTAQTVIDARGASGGGQVRIGGDWQGSGDTRQATVTRMDAGASIDASATDRGNGGQVVLWSAVHDEASVTSAHGEIRANAGANGGDGGRVETSGYVLDTQGISVTAGSRQGKQGQWLLDPYNITIAASSPSGTTYSDNFTAGATSQVLASSIRSSLNAGTSVTISTGVAGSAGADAGDINVNAPIAATGAGNLTLIAARNIKLAADITTAGSQTYDGDVVVTGSYVNLSTLGSGAGADIVFTGDINGAAVEANSLFLQSGSGTIQVAGSVGAGSALKWFGLGGYAAASSVSLSFGYTGGQQTYTVADGVTSLTFDVQGAQGGGAGGASVGGLGGRVTGSLSVTAGEVLYINVGGVGVFNSVGGYNGGGTASGTTYGSGGGGASHIATASGVLSGLVGNKSSVLVVAGGGGGGSSGSYSNVGGAGGGLTGGSGPTSGTFVGGKGGTQVAGGAGGTGYNQTQDGYFGQGGGLAGQYHNPGGGGGWYGGGSGAVMGGGGGSSYTQTGTVSSVSHIQGYKGGNGLITLSGVGKAFASGTQSGAITIGGSVRAAELHTGTGTFDIHVGTTLNVGRASSSATVRLQNAGSISAQQMAIHGGRIVASANLTSSATTGLGIGLYATDGIASNASLSTQGADVLLAANGDGVAGGGIALVQSSITTQGGNITLGGGADGSGYAEGSATASGLIGASDVYKGILLDGASLVADGGDIAIRGRGWQGGSIGGYYPIGVDVVGYTAEGVSFITTTGSGTITIDGVGGKNYSASTYAPGINFFSVFADQANTISAQSGAITLTGVAGSTVGTTAKFRAGINVDLGSVDIVSTSGAIALNGNSMLSTDTGIRLAAASGSLDITSTTGAITLSADRWDLAASLSVQTQESLTIQSQGTSFASAFSLPANLSWSGPISAVTIGKVSNTAAVTLDSALTMSGSLTVYGGDIQVNQSIDSTAAGAAGDVMLKGTGWVALATGQSITTLGGDVVFWADSDAATDALATRDDAILLSGGSSIVTQGGKIVLAGGVDDGTGLPGGFAYRSDSQIMGGVQLGVDGGAQLLLDSSVAGGGGDIVVRGRTGGSNARAGLTTQANFVIQSGTGSITLIGESSVTHGLEFGWGEAGEAAIVSSNTSASAPAISISGNSTAGGTASGLVLEVHAGGRLLIQSLGATGGGVSLTGVNAAGNGYGLYSGTASGSTTYVLSRSGAITLTADGGATAGRAMVLQGTTYLGSYGGTATTVAGVDVWSSTSDANVHLLSTEDIVALGSVTVLTGSTTSLGGEVLFASDTNYATSAGGQLRFIGGLSVQSHGGDIILAGGDLSGSGFARGSGGGFAEGIRLEGVVDLRSAGGDLVLRGISAFQDQASNAGMAGVGMWNNTSTLTIDSGTGSISVHAVSNAYNSSVGNNDAGFYMGGQMTLSSSKLSGRAITLIADGYGVSEPVPNTRGDGDGFLLAAGGSASLLASAGGDILLQGYATGSEGGQQDIELYGVLNVLGTGGTLTVQGASTSTLIDYFHREGGGLYMGAKAGSTITQSESHLVFAMDRISWPTPIQNVRFNTTGSVSIWSASDSFPAGQGSLQTVWFNFDAVPSALNLGKVSDTVAVHVNSSVEVAGPVTVYGGTVVISGTLTQTGAGDIYLQSNNNVNNSIELSGTVAKTAGSRSTLTLEAADRLTITGNVTASGDGILDVVLWSDYDNSNGGGVSLIGANITTNGGHLWAGGSATANGSTFWHGLTVGDGGSTGSSSQNNHSFDFYAASTINSGGGDVLLWATSSSVGSAIQGIGVDGSAISIQAGAGDVTLIADTINGSGFSSLAIYSTGHLSLVPDGGAYASALSWTHNSNWPSLNVGGVYNYLWVNNFDQLSGFTLGRYTGTGLVGDTVLSLGNSSQVTLNSGLKVAGSISVYGSDVVVGAALDTTAGGAAGTVLLKATGNITQNAGVTTSGGHIRYWADADGLGNGSISVARAISTGGGGIWMGGGLGLTTWVPAAGAAAIEVGDGYATEGTATGAWGMGLYIYTYDTGEKISTSGGNFYGRGKSSVATTNSFGIYLRNNQVIVAGTGDVQLDGVATAGTNSAGIYQDATGVDVLSTSGNVTLQGSNSNSAAAGIYWSSSFTTAGVLDLSGTRLSLTANTSLGTSSTDAGALQLHFDNYTLAGNNSLSTAGSLSLASSGAMTVGASGSSLESALLSALSADGGIYLGDETTTSLSIDGAVTMSGQKLVLSATGSVTQSAPLVVGELGLLAGAVNLSNAGNDFSTVAAQGVSSLVLQDTNGFTVGSVNPVGITATSGVELTAATGNIVVNEAIAGSHVLISAPAGTITLNQALDTRGGVATGDSGDITLSAVQITGAGQLLMSGGKAQLEASSATVDSSMGGTIDGATSVVKAGAGRLVLTGTQTYTGAMTIGAGSLVVESDAPWSDWAALAFDGVGALVIRPASTSFSGPLSTSALSLAASLSEVTLGKPGNLATVQLDSNATLSGALTVYGGTVLQEAALNLNGALSISASDHIALGADINTGGAQTYAGAVRLMADVSLIATGALTLNGTLDGAQHLSAQAGAAGTSLNASVGQDVALTSLTVTGPSALGSAAALVRTTGDQSFDGAMSLAATTTFDLGGVGTFTGAISGAGGLTKDGLGVLTLSGANSYLGVTTVNAGTLRISHAEALGSSAQGTDVAANAVLDLRSVIVAGEALSLSDASVLGLNSTWQGAVVVSGSNTVDVAVDASLNFTGGISGTGSLLKQGAGTWTLAAANDFAGSLLVDQGVLHASYTGDAVLHAISGAGTMVVTATGQVTQDEALTVQTLSLRGTGQYLLDHADNAVGVLTAGNADGSGIGALNFSNATSLRLGIAGAQGVAASGFVHVQTRTGDLQVLADVTSQDSGLMAIQLNAGSDAAALDATGGNIIWDAAAAIQAAAGGRVLLYTGSIDASLGVSEAVGLGSARFRYASDEVLKGYQLELGSSGSYAIYREQPVVTVTAHDTTLTVGDAYPGAFTLGAYRLGDTAKLDQTVVTIAGVQTNVGTYTLTPQALSGLGYAFQAITGTLIINGVSTPNSVQTPTGTESTSGGASPTVSGPSATVPPADSSLGGLSGGSTLIDDGGTSSGTGSATTETASTETASTETASTETASTETASTETASTETASTETASTETASTETASTETASTETASTETASTETASTETASTETASTETASTETASTETASTETASTETASTETASTETASTETASTETASTETASTETASTQTASTETASPTAPAAVEASPSSVAAALSSGGDVGQALSQLTGGDGASPQQAAATEQTMSGAIAEAVAQGASLSEAMTSAVSSAGAMKATAERLSAPKTAGDTAVSALSGDAGQGGALAPAVNTTQMPAASAASVRAAFDNAMAAALQSGASPAQALAMANAAAQGMASALDRGQPVLAPAEQTQAALSGTGGASSLMPAGLGSLPAAQAAAVTASYDQALSAALASGMSMAEAMAQAQAGAQAALRSAAAESARLSDPAMAVVSAGQDVGAKLQGLIPGGAQADSAAVQSFDGAMALALASGAPMGDALQAAQNTAKQMAATQRALSLPQTAADKGRLALSSGAAALDALGDPRAVNNAILDAIAAGQDVTEVLAQIASGQRSLAAFEAKPVPPSVQRSLAAGQGLMAKLAATVSDRDLTPVEWQVVVKVFDDVMLTTLKSANTVEQAFDAAVKASLAMKQTVLGVRRPQNPSDQALHGAATGMSLSQQELKLLKTRFSLH